MDFLDRLREKPREVRIRIAFVVAILATVCVGLLWVVSLPVRVDSLAGEEGKIIPEDEQSNLGDLFDLTRTQLESLGGEGEVESDPEPPEAAPGTSGAPLGREVLVGTSSTEAKEQ